MNQEVVDLITDALEEAVDLAKVRHSTGEETFIECRMCKEVDSHKTGCIIETIEKWLKE